MSIQPQVHVANINNWGGNENNLPENWPKIYGTFKDGLGLPLRADLLIDALEDTALQEEVSRQYVIATEKGELNKRVSFESLLILGTAYTFELSINPLNCNVFNNQTAQQVKKISWT